MKILRATWSICVCLLLLLVTVSFAVAQEKPKDKSKDKAKAVASPTPAPAPKKTLQGAMANLRFREIGPATMGGRVNDIEVSLQDTRVIYAAMAGAGIMKSVNGGTTWTPIFDKEAVPSVGDVAIAPSNPQIVWAGTGESNNRQSSSWGNGVYKSMDAGKTWKNMGLPETHHIARVVIHPTNPDIVWVAAVGKLWSSSPERGVFKTTDGGKTWTHTLKVNDDTGATELVIDTESPTILYAAMYQRRRTVFGFNGSGEGSALYKSIDGGDTWTKITKGMPYDTENAPTPRPDGLTETGRNSIAIYAKDTNIVYATIEHANGGVYRSTDKGETWTKMAEIAAVPRPMYFSKLKVDPNNDQRLWLAGVAMQYSEDGGKTWSGNFSRAPHADTHGIWINPNDSNHIIQGNDGGINISYDRGRTWDYANTVPLGQFYEVGADNSVPYKVCGGLQDNNTWCGPSATTNPQGISNSDWYTVGGGDGFFAQPDPNDPDIVYGESQDGNLFRRNVKTGENKSIRPREEEGEKNYRFQWNSPVLISSYDPNTIYYGGNFMFKSTNRGDSWTKIGGVDLTTNVDRNAMQIMGKAPDKNSRSRHDGVQQYPAITTISESPVNKNVLWAGTDDGNLQVTRDSQTWKNVVDKVPGLPKGTYVSRVVASRENEATAYVTFDGHRMGDFKVYVYMTSDYGETWRSIASNLPQNNGIVSVIREHPRNTNLLFVGTEFGLFASTDRGGSWTQIKQNLPTVPVDDILIHPRDNDLILATHGRSIWIMDDITPLQQLNDTVLNESIYLFDTRRAINWRTWSNKPLTSDKAFYGQNPPNGAMINFYLKEPLASGQNITITIADATGQVVRTQNCTRPLPAPATPPAIPGFGGGGGGFGGFGGGGGQLCTAGEGINRWVWDMRARPTGAGPGAGGPGGGGGGGFGGFGAGAGFRVDPGMYTVKIKMGDKEMSKSFEVIEDPRVQFSAEDRAKKKAALAKLLPIVTRGTLAQQQIAALRTNVNTALEAWRRPGANVPQNVRTAGEELLKKIDAAYINWGTPPSLVSTISQAGPPLVELPTPLSQRAAQLMGGIDGTSAAPTAWELSQIDILATRIPAAADEVRNLITVDLAALNAMMIEAKIPHIPVPTGAGGGGPGGTRPPEEDR